MDDWQCFKVDFAMFLKKDTLPETLTYDWPIVTNS